VSTDEEASDGKRGVDCDAATVEIVETTVAAESDGRSIAETTDEQLGDEMSVSSMKGP
jgi:hypothetical protein